MLRAIIDFYSKPLEVNPFTNVYGWARTILAIGTLLILVFNNTGVLFAEGVGVVSPMCVGASRFSIYCFLNSNLEVARYISIVILMVVASGWRPRITGILHWWVSYSLTSTALILEGGDQVTAILTFLLIPVCLFDKRKWHWDNRSEIKSDYNFKQDISYFVGYSTIIVIRLQVAYIYFDAVFQKLKSDDWLNGTAIYYWVLNPYMGSPDFIRFVLKPFVTNAITTPLLTWGVLVFELCLFLALVMPREKQATLMRLGIIFHLILAFVHGLFPFFCAMSAALILYLRPVDKVFDLAQFLKRINIKRFNDVLVKKKFSSLKE